MRILALSLAVMTLLVTACAVKNVTESQERMPMGKKTIEEVLREHTPGLMSLPGVVGTAQGLCDEKPCIVIYVTKKTPDLEQKIPPSLDGFPVTIEETGEIRALPPKKK